ncbi:MAG: acyl carrier protein [Anaerolineae bacterium]|nr:acyl carrier protein [Anaerolineae bacterium]
MTEEAIYGKLRTFICQKLLRRPNYPLEPETSLIAGGLIDSFSLVQIGLFVEDEFQIHIPDKDFNVENLDTLQAISQYVVKALHR